MYVCHGPAFSVTPIKSIFKCEDGGELIHFHAFANQLLQLMVKISCAQSNLKTFTSRCACPKHALHAPSSYGCNNFQLTIEIWLVLDELLVRPWPDRRLHPC